MFITSKILAIHQGRCAPVESTSKKELIRQEADYHMSYVHNSQDDINLTITDNILIPAAGIDESNGNGYYIMWPKDTDALCREIRARLLEKNKISNLGIVSTDSHTTPLRWGVTGITTGIAGIVPLKDVRGEKDLFGREMHLTQVNVIDPLASMAVLLMGECSECTPIVILRGYKKIEFSENASMIDFKIPPHVDLYQPLLKVFTK